MTKRTNRRRNAARPRRTPEQHIAVASTLGASAKT
jgi:hypothetical protein